MKIQDNFPDRSITQSIVSEQYFAYPLIAMEHILDALS